MSRKKKEIVFATTVTVSVVVVFVVVFLIAELLGNILYMIPIIFGLLVLAIVWLFVYSISDIL